jgi:integrase
VNFELRTVRVTSKPELGFYPKRWEDREIPAPVELIEELRKHTHRPNCEFVFPSPTGNREQHMLDHCKSIAKRAKLDSTKFDLKTFRSTYATGMLRRGSMYGPCSTGWATSPWRRRCATWRRPPMFTTSWTW